MKLIGDHKNFSSVITPQFLDEWPDNLALIDIQSHIPEGFRAAECIAVYDHLRPGTLLHLMLAKGFAHAIHRNSPFFLQELRLAAQMIHQPQAFMADPIGHMFRNIEVEHRSFRFHSSTQKDELLEEMRKYMYSFPHMAGAIDSMLTLADELFTNAIFHGPHDVDNLSINESKERSAPVRLAADQHASLTVIRAKDAFFVACEDPFGSYIPERVLFRLDETFKRGVSQAMHMGEGGAGIGCRMMFDMTNGFYSAVDPGKRTFVAFRVPIGHGSRLKELSPKNIHYTTVTGGKMGQLKVNEQKKGEQATIEFFGQVDEDADLTKIDLSKSKKLTLDLGGITLINSCGIREWVNWIRKAPDPTQLTLKKCPKVIVDQMNMVDGFIPKGAKLESFFVPYFCESCEHLSSVLLTSGKDFSDGKVSFQKSIKCPNCAKDAEIDVIEAQYFRFIEMKHS